MSATTALLPPKTVTLQVYGLSKTQESACMRFHRDHGHNMLLNFLIEAGCPPGEWHFRIFDTFPGSGGTKPIQVRRPATDGVVIWLKPGSNGSGVKGTLIVTRDRSVTVEALFAKLRAYAVEVYGGRSTEVDHVETVPTPDRVNRLLRCVYSRLCVKSHWPSIDAFLEELLAEEPASRADVEDEHSALLEDLEYMVDRGLLTDAKTHYRLSANGEHAMHASQPTPAAPPVPAVPPTTDTGDPVGLIAKHRDRLRQLLELPELVAACRQRQTTLSGQIEKLMADLDVAQAEERELLKGVDIDALSKLFG